MCRRLIVHRYIVKEAHDDPDSQTKDVEVGQKPLHVGGGKCVATNADLSSILLHLY